MGDYHNNRTAKVVAWIITMAIVLAIVIPITLNEWKATPSSVTWPTKVQSDQLYKIEKGNVVINYGNIKFSKDENFTTFTTINQPMVILFQSEYYLKADNALMFPELPLTAADQGVIAQISDGDTNEKVIKKGELIINCDPSDLYLIQTKDGGTFTKVIKGEYTYFLLDQDYTVKCKKAIVIQGIQKVIE